MRARGRLPISRDPRALLWCELRPRRFYRCCFCCSAKNAAYRSFLVSRIIVVRLLLRKYEVVKLLTHRAEPCVARRAFHRSQRGRAWTSFGDAMSVPRRFASCCQTAVCRIHPRVLFLGISSKCSQYFGSCSNSKRRCWYFIFPGLQ